MSDEQEQDAFQLAFEFLEDERARRNIVDAIARDARSLVIRHMADDAVFDTAHVFWGTPTGRPRLQRQSAMHPFFEPDEVHQQNLLNFLLLLTNVPDDDDMKAEPKEYDFSLTTAAVEQAWQCVICQENGGDVVVHPNNCHTYHRHCLNEALHVDIRCPLCRGCVTPLMMIKINY